VDFCNGLRRQLFDFLLPNCEQPAYGSEGREFQSLRAHQKSLRIQDRTWILFCFRERVVLQEARRILDSMEVHHKEWAGGRMKKYSTSKTRIFAGCLPVNLLNETHKFKGSNTYHLERALRLCVRGPKTRQGLQSVINNRALLRFYRPVPPETSDKKSGFLCQRTGWVMRWVCSAHL
jgi:hypothetical protein